MAPLDTSRLVPLDTSGFDPVDDDTRLNASGLVPLDTSGFVSVDETQPTDPRPRGYMPTPETDETTKRFDRREARLNPPEPKEPNLRDPSKPESTWLETAASLPDQIGAAFRSSLYGAIEAATSQTPGAPGMGANMPYALQEDYFQVQRERRDAPGGVDDWARDATKVAIEDMQEAAPNVDPDSLKGYANDLAVSLAQMLPAVATAMTTRNPTLGATVMGGQVFGQQYGQSIQDGRSHEAAMADGAFMALAEAIPERIPLGILIKPGKTFASRVLKMGGAEGFQETITAILQTGYEAGILREDMTWGEAWEQVKRSAILGTAMGVTVAGVTEPFVRGERETQNPGDMPPMPPQGDRDDEEATRAAIDALDPAQQPPTNIAPPKRMAPVTPEDEASDLPTPLISRGKAVIDDILSGRETDFGDSALPAPADLEPVYDFDDDGNRGEQIGWTNPQTREFLSLEEGNRVRQSPPADSATQGRGLLAGQVGEGMSIPELSGERTSITPSLSPDLPPVTPTASPDRPQVAPTSPAQPSGDVELVDPDTIQADPQTFQFKSGGDAQGVTDTLKGTPAWNSDYAGVAIVWERADGQRFIVDGHQRLGLAKRAKAAGQNGVQMRVRVFREADGVTAQEATFKGALKNIAEGGESTKPIDVARLLRNAANRDDAIAEAQKFIPPRRRAFQDGVALSGLGDQAWGMVINETVPANFAAVVGQRIEDPAQQVAALGYIAKNPPGNIDQARMVVDQIKAAGFSEGTQESLFGSETLTESLISERAKVLDSAIRNLKAMKKVFKTAVDGGDILAAAGNVLDADANQQQLSENERLAMVLEKLAQRRGPVSDALSEAARALKAGESVAKARERFLEAVRAVENFDDGASAPVSGGRGGNAGASTDTVSDQEVDPDAPERDPNTDDMFGAPPAAEAEAPPEPRTERTDQGENYVLGDDIAPEVQPGDRERERERQQAEDAAKEADVRQNQSKIRRGDQEGVEGLGMFDTQGDMLNSAAQQQEKAESEQAPTPPAPTAAPELTIRDFSEKSIIVEGKTKENLGRIKGAISRRPLWNKGAKGWIFRKADEAAVREALADLLGAAPAQETGSADIVQRAEDLARRYKAEGTSREKFIEEAPRILGWTVEGSRRIDRQPDGANIRQAFERAGYQRPGNIAEVWDRANGAAPTTTQARPDQPSGPRVFVNKVGRDGKTDAERGGPLEPIGQNYDGQDIFEDANGARYILNNGIRQTEPVATNPRGGVTIPTNQQRLERGRDNFLTTEELQEIQAGQVEPDKSPEQQDIAEGRLPIEDDRDRQRRENIKKMQESSGENNAVPTEGAQNEPPSAASRPADYGKGNKLFPEDKAKAARDRIRAKLKRLNTGIDPELILDGTILAGYHVEAGVRKFGDFARTMIGELGEDAKPYLKMWYNAVRDYPGMMSGDMTPYGEVDATDLDALLGGETDGLQGSIRDGDARAGAGNVQGTSENGGDGRAPANEVSGSAPSVRGTDEGRTEDGERPSATGSTPGSRGNGVRNDDRVSEGAGNAGSTGARNQPLVSQNYHIEPGALDEGRSWKQKANDNIAAIELLQRIEAEARPATPSEQETLARYVGWGGIKGAFPDTKGEFGKGFEKIGARVRELLTPEEYATAERSIQYAHYTSETIVRAMWASASRLGFTGGKVFEPGMGVGNFAGMMPRPIADRTAYNGLEMDGVTSRIAKLLYPKWGVRQGDFTQSPLPKDTYDMVIGNPPFADITIQSDPEYRSNGFLLHDYFFAKSLDGVRPGGLLMFISSAGTMNKLDTKAREYLADRADLVGAVRLPGNAFSKNAGTEVTTDIVILRKRLPNETAGDRTWTETVAVTLPGPDGTPTDGRVNRYFHENPDMVLGEQGFFDKLYKGRYGVRATPGVDIEAAITEAMGRLPVDVMKPWADTTERAELDFSSTEKKDGTYYIGSDGGLYQQSAGQGVKVQLRGKGVKGGKSSGEVARIKKLIPIRDALRDVYAADLADDTAAGDKARKALNKSYDAFVAEFGPINKVELSYSRPTAVQQENARSAAREEARYRGEQFDEGSFDPNQMIDNGETITNIAKARKAERERWEAEGRAWMEGTFDPDDMPDNVRENRLNIKMFMDDPESYRLRSIEHHNDETGQAEKALVFFENVISKDRAPEIKSAADALLYVLRQTGGTDINEIARYAGKSVDETLSELGDSLFENPANPGSYETKGAYLSGNVRQKLRVAQQAAETNDRFLRNVKALEAAQPIPLTPRDITVNLGMPWVPTELIEQFGMSADGMGLESLNVSYDPVFANWKVSGDTDSAAASSAWGTDERNGRAPAILQSVLNRQTIKVTRRDSDGSTYTDPVATAAIAEKAANMKERFSAWVWEDPQRAQELADFYNETQNNLVVQEFDGSYLTTPGIASNWSWRPHQKRVMARIIQNGNTYMAHAVGAGKTSAMIGAGMEMRRLGMVRKPMYVVPNHMLAQFSKEFYEQYPTARIMVADEAAFHTDRRKQFVANAASQDLDAVIITHSSFGKIPISDEFSDRLIEQQLNEYRELLAELESEKGEDNRVMKGKIQAQIERMEQRLRGRKNARADQVFTFEEMGVDFLFVDEAHLFRKLDFATKMGNIKGIDPKGSDASWDLFVKSKYLNEQNPGRSLVLASGTPVTNTMAELFTVSRYLQEAELADRGLSQFDAWAGSFGDTKVSIEDDPAGGYKTVTRFSQFNNVPELSNMVRQVMDVVTSEELAQYVTRPKIRGGKRELHLVEKSDELSEYQETLARRMQEIAARRGPPEPGDDIILNVINDGRHAAIDMRLTDMVEDKMRWRSNMPSKLDVMIGKVHEIYVGSTRQPFHGVKPEGGYTDKPIDKGPATQMIFANLGLGDKRGFKVPDAIRSELRRRGVPDKEIAYIADYKTQAQRQRLFNDMNEGKVRILIGSTAKMGTGVNAQKRLLAIHNLDPLWFPADDEQRNGRALRQGNMNPEIQIHDYGTKGTYDATMWSLMGTKARFIEGFFRGDPSLRDMEDLGEAGLYEQAKALSTNDPRLIVLTEKRQELQKMDRAADAFERETYMAQQKVRGHERSAAYNDKLAAAYDEAIAKRIDTQGDKFKGTVEGKEYTDRIEFGDAVLGVIALEVEKKSRSGIKDKKIATLAGFDITLDVTASNGKDPGRVYLEMVLTPDRSESLSTSTSARGLTQAFESVPRALEAKREKAIAEAAEDRRLIEQFRPIAERERQDMAALRALADEVQQLEAEILGSAQEESAVETAEVESNPAAGDLQDRRGRLQAPGTSAFKRWFGDSKVVDANGKPLVVYHGTPDARGLLDDGAFEARIGGDGVFFFTDSPRVAATYADPMRAFDYQGARPAVGKLYLSLQNPMIIDAKGASWGDRGGPQSQAEQIAEAKAKGHDGIIIRNTLDTYNVDGNTRADVFIAFEPTQIKSAETGPVMDRYDRTEIEGSGPNRGTYDPNDPRIRYRAPGQEIDFDAFGTRPTRTADGERAARAVIALLRKIAPRSRVQAFDNIVDADGNILGDGHYLDGVISIALTGNNVLGTARHEAIHFLKEIGAIRPDQWLALRSAAIRENWIKRHNIRERYRKERLTEEQLLEEAIAEEYTKWATGTTERPGAVQRAFAAMRRLFSQIRAAIREVLGYDPDASDVFSWIESGQIGAQERVRPTTGMETASAIANGRFQAAQTPPPGNQNNQGNLGQQFTAGQPGSQNQQPQRRQRGAQQNSLGIMNIALPDKGVFDNLFNGNRSFTQNLRGAVSRAAIRASGNDLREYMQDSFIRLRRVQEAITQITGQPLSEAEDAYRAEEMFAGRVGARLDEVQREHKEPLARAIADTLGGKTMTIPDGDGGQMEATGYEILEAYLYARHAPERNKQIAGINPDFPDGGSGMTDADAATIMSTLRRDGLMADVQSLADMVDTMLRDSLEKRVQYGLMSQQDALKWRQTYQNYVPLRGIQELGDDGDADPARPRSGQGYNVRGPESKRALGRRSRSTDILANVFTIADEAVIRGEKNTVFKAFHNLVSNHPDPDLWEINPVRMAYGINKQTGQVELRPVSALTAAQADHTVRGKINGQEVRIQIHDTHLAEAMNKVGANHLNNIFAQAAAVATRYLSAVNTSWNPDFMITNAFRDVQAAGILLQQHDIKGITKATILNWRRGLTAVMEGQGITRTARGAGVALDPAERARWKQIYEEFNRAGGRVNFFKIEDINDHKKAFAEAMRDASPSAGRKLFLAARGIGRYVENLNIAVDNAVRLSAYKAARDAGWSEQQAASLAKNLTVNFNRKGRAGPALNAAYMFFNAAVQGTHVLVSSLRRSKRVRRAVVGLMVAGFMVEMLNVMLSPEDDETGELDYDKIGGSRESADFLKSRNIILVDPFGLTDDKYFTIPLPYGFNLFWDTGRNMAAYVRGGQTAGRTLGNIARTGIDAFNPIGSGSIANTIAPTLLDPVFDLIQNQNFMGGRIYPAPFEFDQSPPPLSAQPWKSTSVVSKEIAEVLNDLTGGDRITPGAIDLPPQALDHIAGFLTGGAGRFYGGALDAGMRSITAFSKGETPDLTIRDVPLVRKIVRPMSDYRDRRDAYEAIGEIQEVAGRYRDYVKAGRPADDKDPSAGREPLIGLYKQAGKVKKALSDIRKERIRLEGLGYRPDSPEIERINAIEDRTIKLLMVRYRAAKKKMGNGDGTADYIDSARRAIGTGGER